MSIDSALKAALGYMLPQGSNVDSVVTTLYDRVEAEAKKSDAILLRWQGEKALAKGYGHLVIHVERICAWQHWRICRRDRDNSEYPIMSWESVDIYDDDDDDDDE